MLKIDIFRILADFDRFSTLTLDMGFVSGFGLDEMNDNGRLDIFEEKNIDFDWLMDFGGRIKSDFVKNFKIVILRFFSFALRNLSFHDKMMS